LVEELKRHENVAFASFCKQHGLPDISAYEEDQVKLAQKQLEQHLQFTDLLSKIQQQ
jgi:hypothetical protein